MVALNRLLSRLSWDVIGFSASGICAIHCLILPGLLLLPGLSGNASLHNHTIETWILVFSATVGSLSIIPSFFRHHRKLLPLIIFIQGIALIALGRFDFALTIETLLTTVGASLVATAHWINWKLCRPYHLQSVSKRV